MQPFTPSHRSALHGLASSQVAAAVPAQTPASAHVAWPQGSVRMSQASESPESPLNVSPARAKPSGNSAMAQARSVSAPPQRSIPTARCRVSSWSRHGGASHVSCGLAVSKYTFCSAVGSDPQPKTANANVANTRRGAEPSQEVRQGTTTRAARLTSRRRDVGRKGGRVCDMRCRLADDLPLAVTAAAGTLPREQGRPTPATRHITQWFGGSAGESNSPETLVTPHSGFEDRGVHQNPRTSVGGSTALAAGGQAKRQTASAR
jgi:hypothetical protein